MAHLRLRIENWSDADAVVRGALDELINKSSQGEHVTPIQECLPALAAFNDLFKGVGPQGKLVLIGGLSIPNAARTIAKE